MPGVTLPPDQGAHLGRLIARVEHRERHITSPPKAQVWLPQLFSYSGSLIDGIESAPWYPEHGIAIYSFRVAATGPPSGSDLHLQVRLDGADYATLTLTDSTIMEINAVSVRVPSSSYLAMRVDDSASAFDVSVGCSYGPL